MEHEKKIGSEILGGIIGIAYIVAAPLIGITLLWAVICICTFGTTDGKAGHTYEVRITNEEKAVNASIFKCLDTSLIPEQVMPPHYDHFRDTLLRLASAQFINSAHQPISTATVLESAAARDWMYHHNPTIGPSIWAEVLQEVSNCHTQNAAALTIVRNDAESFRKWIRSAPITHGLTRYRLFPDSTLQVYPSLTGQEALDYLTEVTLNPVEAPPGSRELVSTS